MVRELMEPDPRPVIAFAGGGASAALAAVALLRATTWLRLPYRIVLVDEHGRHARGAAYSTTDDAHLLNAPVKTMSALPDQPGHLAGWLRRNGHPAGPETFPTRRVYGDYLARTLDETARWAHPYASLETRTARVESARPTAEAVELRLSGGGRLDAAALVVATGNSTEGSVLGRAAPPGTVTDPWHPREGVAALAGCERVLAVGTGLTMVDSALTLTGANPRAVVHAASRTGLLPHAHRPPLATPPGLVDLASGQNGPLPLRGLVRRLRAAVDAYPGDWRHVVDSLRPHTQTLWQGLSPDEQRCFLERLSRRWENARHRMAPETATRVTLLRATGRLRTHGGGVRGVVPAGSALRATLGDGSVVEVDAVLDCTGSAPGRAPLVARLLADGLARPDHLGLGVHTCPRGALVTPSGRVSRRLFALGPPRRGQLYETTAIPEIRDQAEQLAQRIADTVLRDRRDAPTAVV
ncbi:FAD/NAD(P)-binding protein [Actinorugispora endophytica]|uniref:Putative NAD(P)/FAD-binding protein YdhS n=1 Tax=Actinorugispora endophytica TaxID=1605990 RepID=A0A4R6UK74_9ACTN|nr:FAD/NAD(P)-binding protein [Actinorugispora endophytica]TDQ45869.1 putative NAD(P)/FAD-binding protein YdhS [Actinorugispora endophytica]